MKIHENKRRLRVNPYVSQSVRRSLSLYETQSVSRSLSPGSSQSVLWAVRRSSPSRVNEVNRIGRSRTRRWLIRPRVDVFGTKGYFLRKYQIVEEK